MFTRFTTHLITCLFLCLSSKTADAEEGPTTRVRLIINLSHQIYEKEGRPTCSVAGRFVPDVNLAAEGPKKPILYAGAKCGLNNGFQFGTYAGYHSAAGPFGSIGLGYKSEYFITSGQLDLDPRWRMYSNLRLAGKYKWFSLGPMYEGLGYLGKNFSPGIGLSPALHFGKWGALIGLVEYHSSVAEDGTRQGGLGTFLLFVINLHL